MQARDIANPRMFARPALKARLVELAGRENGYAAWAEQRIALATGRPLGSAYVSKVVRGRIPASFPLRLELVRIASCDPTLTNTQAAALAPDWFETKEG